MSYFIGGYHTDIISFKHFIHDFTQIVPESIANNDFHHNYQHTFLSIYGHKKVLPNFFHKSKENGSWLAIIGSPLIEYRNENDKDHIINTFFKNPKNFINEKIDGSWCIFAYDSVCDKFYAVTDYDNTVPIYYAKTSTGIYFSSHELPLARFLASRIDPLGFSMTVQLRLTWGPFTRFRGINKLCANQILVFSGMEKSSISYYWLPSEEKQWDYKFNDAINNWLDILKKSVYSYFKLSQNKSVICEITGGEDSRLILSAVHNLNIPFTAMVDGNEDDLDVIIANNLSKKGNFALIIRPNYLKENLLLDKAVDIALYNDAYHEFFASFSVYVLDSSTPLLNYENIKYCGVPGGEVFRGSYYLRGKAIFPSALKVFDKKFFVKMKFFLDFLPGLLNFSDNDLKQVIFEMIDKELKEVNEFPAGTKIDHMLRVFQVCTTGLIFKLPRYLPFATKNMTKSIYWLPPKFKSEGKLTKACTEILYPEISIIKTQKGVPTIRRKISRYHLFIPEYKWTLDLIISGVLSRLFKWKDSKKPYFSLEKNSRFIKSMLSTVPYNKWFLSPTSMITGDLYSYKTLDAILNEAKKGTPIFLPTLGRIISQELAMRWVFKDIQ